MYFLSFLADLAFPKLSDLVVVVLVQILGPLFRAPPEGRNLCFQPDLDQKKKNLGHGVCYSVVRGGMRFLAAGKQILVIRIHLV